MQGAENFKRWGERNIYLTSSEIFMNPQNRNKRLKKRQKLSDIKHILEKIRI